MSAPSSAFGGFSPDGLQALMFGNWNSPPNRLPSAPATEYQSSFPHIHPPIPMPRPMPMPIPPQPQHLPVPASSIPLGFPDPSPGRSPSPASAQVSSGGFGFAFASASASAAASLGPAGTATAPSRSVGNINFTTTSTPTPHPFSTLAGLARQRNQAFAALHSAFASPHLFNPSTFGAHLSDVHNLNHNLHPPNANAFLDHLATSNFPPPPNFLQPPFFSPLHHRACGFHVLPQSNRPVGPSPLPYSTPVSQQFDYYFQAPNLEAEGFDLRGNLDDVSHDEDNSPVENLQEHNRLDDDDDDIFQDEHPRIAVDSLLDENMPPVGTSRKRTRAAASLDEPAGPATVKRQRSPSGSASVSNRKPIKPRKAVSTVVIPDSDDVFAIDDEEGKQEMYDMTENDHLPEDHKEVEEDTSTKLCKFECIICLDAASTLTVTHCGHMFCGPCLHQAMHAEVTKKICPMCRQKLDTRPRNTQPAKSSRTFFHLEMKIKPSKRQGKQPIRPVRR